MVNMPPAQYMKLLLATLIFLTVARPLSVQACGWWGDGETNREDISAIPTHDGKPLPEHLDMKSSKLPGRMGYGMAIPEPGKAIPYLQATFGRPINKIKDLKTFGFSIVIDLGTTAKTATRHRAETEAAGMGYHNIPVQGEIPTIDQARRFSEIVLGAAAEPLLVYAPTSELLSMMWALHRLSMGSTVEFAIKEGRLFGLTEAQAKLLRQRNKF